MKRTPLFDGHRALNAKLVEFAGWEMPIQYTGVVEEYQTVRSTAGLFDVSHMGRLKVTGEGAAIYLQRVTTNNVSKLEVWQSHYSMVCNPQGGIKDDMFVYRLGWQEFLLCVNASNREKIVAWLREQTAETANVDVQDRSADIAQLALQGPASRSILNECGAADIALLAPRQCLETKLFGVPLLITRTGYTGELGYELYVPAEEAVRIWNELLMRGRSAGLKPAGLGARDLLRLEMAYLLYGNDINEETTPLEAGTDWIVDFQKGDFIGREALQRQQNQGVSRRLAAFELLEKAVPRHGFKIVSGAQPERNVIGEVTSGNFSPILQKGIGLGYVPPAMAAVGTRILIEIRSRIVPAVVVKPPFYRKRPEGSG